MTASPGPRRFFSGRRESTPDPGSQVVRVPHAKLASAVQEARREVAEFAHAVTSVVQGMDPGIPVDDVVRILTEGHR